MSWILAELSISATWIWLWRTSRPPLAFEPERWDERGRSGYHLAREGRPGWRRGGVGFSCPVCWHAAVSRLCSPAGARFLRSWPSCDFSCWFAFLDWSICFADDVSFCFDLQNKANCWNSAFSTCVSTTFGLRYLVSFTAGNELIKLTHSPSQHCRGCHGDVMPWTAQLCCRACWENYPQWNPDDDGRSRWAWDWGRTQSVFTFDPPKAEN